MRNRIRGGERVADLPGSFGGLELGGAQFNANAAIGAVAGHLGLNRKYGGQQA